MTTGVENDTSSTVSDDSAEEYKTAYFDNLIENLLKSYEDDEEIDIKELYHKVVMRASKAYSNTKLMSEDKLWEKLIDKADTFSDMHPNIANTETAFQHAMRSNNELILGIINNMLESDNDDHDDDDDDDAK